MNRCLILWFTAVFGTFISAFAQERITKIQDGREIIYIDGLPLLTEEDSIFQSTIPVMVLPENYQRRQLPVNVDNSLLPYFRPIFNQSSLECGQASAVGYAFTYEIDRLRDLPANVPENQYPTHFVFNWSNLGSGTACAFFDSWNIIREVGTPNVTDYGGSLNYGGVARWMNGYDSYYRAMKNRLWEFYRIPLNDETGLLTLKHWINDHLDGSSTGGVANIYCSYMSANQQLPPGTPEAGKYVLTSLGSYANHGLCIVGYHDSIRWDYNNDGQYTNHIDINNDGTVDFRDWEIGGVKLANSYSATSWGNQGFAYLMYNALCRSLAQSGVWNQCANIHYAKENTNPQLTYKVTLTHDTRNEIKVMAGVSPQANATQPAYVIDFPIINYQGGAKFMQGGTTEADKTLEFGLDVTPLLSYIESSQEATFFLLVDEDDADNSGTGSINNWSVMDYTGELIEIPCNQSNVPLVENGLTMLSISTSIDFIQPDVLNADLPPATVNEPYECQMIGTQGTEPYRWYLKQKYLHAYTEDVFPLVTAQQLTPNNGTTGYASKQIDFEFPYYGNKYNKIYIHTDGYLMFEANEFPWTFVVDESNILKNLCNISPFMTKTLGTSGGGGMWYEGDENSATFRWKAKEYGTENWLNFAVKLFPSGLIEMYYGSVTISPWVRWYAGVSEGDGTNWELFDISNTYSIQPNFKIVVEPDYSFTEMNLTREGLFHGTPTVSYEAVDIDFLIRDANGMRNTRTLPFFTSGTNKIIIKSVTVQAGGDDIIEYGENVSLTIELQNVSDEMVNAQEMSILINDQYVVMNDSIESLTGFQPGEIKTLTNAFNFDVSEEVPNNYDFVFATKVTSDVESYNSHIYLKAYAPVLMIGAFQVDDGGNGYLEPGETADLIFEVKNFGGGNAYNVVGALLNTDLFITINNNTVDLGDIPANSTANAIFNITINETTPIGHVSLFTFNALADFGFNVSKTVSIMIGFIVEDFETGDFSQYDWDFGGNSFWMIDQAAPYEGQYCMKSGPVGDFQSSEVFVTMEIFSESTISFFYKVSSEANYDFLRFLIDGSAVGAWSGQVGWAQATYPVTAGEHTFKWKYEKDVNTVGGSDCAWVDFIIFPPGSEQTVAVAVGPDMTTCEDQSVQLTAMVINAVSLEWSTSGDGTFSNTTIAEPEYMPGTQDISSGMAILTLTGYDAGGGSVSDDMTLYVSHLPIVWAGEDTDVCEDVDMIDLSGVVVNTTNYLWSTTGDGTFGNPAMLVTTYYPGINDLANGSVMLTLTGFPVLPCTTNVSHSISITFLPLPVVTFAPVDNFCHNSPPYELTEGSPAGGIYSGPSVVNGWFYPEEAGIGTHLLTYTYSDENGCENSADREVTIDDCTSTGIPGQGEISIIPNPGNGRFILHYPGASGKEIPVKIISSTGKQIFNNGMTFNNENSSTIILSDQPEGIYFVILSGDNETVRLKLVISR